LFTKINHLFKSAASFLAEMSYFRLIRLTYLLDDRPGGYGPFLGRLFTSSGAFSFNETFDSLINKITLHIKLAETTEYGSIWFDVEAIFL
jgi:hypothetical protein